MIEVNLAILADAANTSADGKLNILGEFNMLMAPAQPWTMVGRSLVVRFEGNAGDAGPHTLGLRLLNEDRQLVWAAGDKGFGFPRAKIPGTPARAVAIIPLPPLLLPVEGVYELEIMVDAQVQGSLALYCVLGTAPAGDAGA